MQRLMYLHPIEAFLADNLINPNIAVRNFYRTAMSYRNKKSMYLYFSDFGLTGSHSDLYNRITQNLVM